MHVFTRLERGGDTPSKMIGDSLLIIYRKKLLNSDWLRKECKMCNTSAKMYNTVEMTHRNSGL